MKVLADEIAVRWAIQKDLPALMDIDEVSYLNALEPYQFPEFAARFNGITLVAETGDTVLGYVLFELLGSKIVVRRLAVDPAFRRLGVGTKLVGKLIGKLSEWRSRLVVYTGVNKFRACRFLSSCGLLAEEVERHGTRQYRFVYCHQWADDAEGDCNGR
jgi:ribosomal protein S18 acetylase RimI-like enzyme